MDKIVQRLKAYIDTYPFDPGDSDCEIVLDQLYQAYAESHESDPPEIIEGFKDLEEILCTIPLEDNNTVFNLCFRLCSAYERKAFIAGVPYGAYFLSEIILKESHVFKELPLILSNRREFVYYWFYQLTNVQSSTIETNEYRLFRGECSLTVYFDKICFSSTCFLVAIIV